MWQRVKISCTVNNAQIVLTSSYKATKTRTQIAKGKIQALTQSQSKVRTSIQKAVRVEAWYNGYGTMVPRIVDYEGQP